MCSIELENFRERLRCDLCVLPRVAQGSFMWTTEQLLQRRQQLRVVSGLQKTGQLQTLHQVALYEIWFFVPKSFKKSLYIGSCSITGSCIFWHVIAIDPLVSKWGCCRWFYTSWEQNPSWLYMRELSFTTTANLEHPLKLKDVWCDLCHSWIKWRMNGMVLASDCKWFCSFCLRLLV